MAIKKINIGDQQYVLSYKEIDEDIDIDELLKIDYSHLVEEIITFPVWVNRFGNLLAEAEKQLSEMKLNLDITEARIKENLRKEAVLNGEKAPTVETLNNAVILNQGYIALKKKFIESQKTRDYVNSVYWSAKDKSEKLDKLSLSLQPGDIQENQIEGTINRVTIKRTKKLID